MDNTKSGFEINSTSFNLTGNKDHVSSFYVNSNMCNPFQALERFVAWMNEELDENFQVKDLSDMSNYEPDWEHES